MIIYVNKLLEDFAKIHFKIRYAGYRQKYKLSRKFKFNGWNITFYGDGDIVAGEGSYIGRQSSIQIDKGYKVSIGKKVSISHFVHMYTTNHKADKDFSIIDNSMRSGDIEIGDYCWIGIKSTIIGPVQIGENTVIASNSLVSKNIPPHSIAIGVPAQVIKFKSYLPLEEQIELARQYQGSISQNLLKKFKIETIVTSDKTAMLQDVQSIENLYEGETIEVGYGEDKILSDLS